MAEQCVIFLIIIKRSSTDSNNKKFTENGEIDQFQLMIGKGPSEYLDKKELLSYFKGMNQEYLYRIVIEKDIERPLVKERNFE